MINQLLNNFLTSKVNPKAEVVTQALESQERLKTLLAAKLTVDPSLPFVLQGQDFLFGSAIRGTQGVPFDDVDLMLVLDGAGLHPIENGQVAGSVFGSRRLLNPLATPRYKGQDGLISSQKVLAHIREAIADSYPQSSIRTSGQAINVKLTYGFGIDVVPAFRIRSLSGGEYYYIPFGTGSEMWRHTNPWADINAFQSLETTSGGYLRAAARLMRQWNELKNGGRLKGFHVDALVYRSLYGKQVTSLEHAMLLCVFCFEDLLGAPCPQFSGFTPHIDAGLSLEDRGMSVNAIKRLKQALSDASSPVQLAERRRIWNDAFDGRLY